ncbi:putative quinol monooxygenase [Inquilinus sp. OTU3971]|uniref:putative quinol monooxygenase n=1 Tax=Inquilinus sp. OTU3971 TaxID=3043855 RepID=UPI00313AA8E8
MRTYAIAAALLAAAGTPAVAGGVSSDIDAAGYFDIATFTVKADKAGDFEAIMKQVVIDTRAEPGNIDYRLHKVSDRPLTYVTYEVFKDKAAADAHNASEHIRRIVPPLLETLDGEIKVIVMEAVR